MQEYDQCVLTPNERAWQTPNKATASKDKGCWQASKANNTAAKPITDTTVSTMPYDMISHRHNKVLGKRPDANLLYQLAYKQQVVSERAFSVSSSSLLVLIFFISLKWEKGDMLFSLRSLKPLKWR